MNSNKKDKLQECLYTYVRDHYWGVWKISTNTLSSTCRQLGLGIGGICLTIRTQNYFSDVASVCNLVFIFLILFFILDAAQYLSSLIIYKDVAEKLDEKITNSEINNLQELTLPANFNRFPNLFFTLKLFTLTLSSILVIYLLLII
jgi:hypothetical protein